MSGVRPGVNTPSGKYIHRAPLRHCCKLPTSGANDGDVWRCNCRQAWMRKGRKWVKVNWPPTKEEK